MILYVDIIDACHMRCPTCARGVRAFPNTSRKMPLETFRRIVEKGHRDGAYQISIFSWIDPFLCQDLHEYTAAIQANGLPSEISTTLSFRRIAHLESALQTLDRMTISVSGFDQEVYEVNHRGGNVAWVKNNLELISRFKSRHGAGPDAVVRFLLFDYNHADRDRFRQFAGDLGLRFEVAVAEGHPRLAPQPQDAERYVIERMKNYSTEPSQALRGKVCPLIFEHITLNAEGDVYQCTPYGNYAVMKIGPYLDLSREEILFRRYTHPVCNSCPWTRRAATKMEKLLLFQALMERTGGTVTDRVTHLSLPTTAHPLTDDGYLAPKSQAARWP